MKLLETDGPRLHALLFRMTLRYDVAEDLMQDLVLKLAQSDGFAKAQSPYTYGRTAASNLALDWRRKQIRRRTQSEAALMPGDGEAGGGLVELPACEALPGRVVEREEQIGLMLDEVARLPARSRQVLTMRFFDRASYNEVAQELGTTASKARGLCFTAIRQLRKRLGAGADPGALDERTVRLG